MNRTYIVLGILILIGLSALGLHHFIEQRQESIDDAWRNYDATVAATKAEMDAKVREAGITLNAQFAERQYGSGVASDYLLCEHSAPTKPKNQRRCAYLVPKIQREAAAAEKRSEW